MEMDTEARRMRRLVLFVGVGALEQCCAFTSKHKNVILDYRPDEFIIYRRVLVGQLVSEVNDTSGVSD